MYKLVIVGRPNVGKSALFNRICKKRISIVDQAEGVTRDRIYAEAEIFGTPFEVIDTGGIASKGPFQEEICRQAEIALEEADAIIMVVDSQVGVTKNDAQLASQLLKMDKPLTLAVNKIDHPSQEIAIHGFHHLGIERIVAVSATHGYQIAELIEKAWEGIDLTQEIPTPPEGVKISLIGRTNVGKSTLINALLSDKRCLVSPIPGTTRDRIEVPFQYDKKDYVLVDTAGIRRKKAEKEVVEKFAAMRTEKAIELSDICLLLLDAQDGITTQDKRIAKHIEKSGKGCIVLLNKWDLVKGFRMEHCMKALREASPFLKHCPILFISAKDGRNLDQIFPTIETVYAAVNQRISTHQLNTFMERTIQLNHPPMITGKRLRIYYLTQVSSAPPRFALL